MSSRASIFMERTEVPAERSAAEITGLLVRAGAHQIATDYNQGTISGIRFCLLVNGMSHAFDLPARTDPVYRALVKRSPWTYSRAGTRDQYEQKMREKARQVGWRQLLRWVEAQLAMIECGMADAQEVFLPYVLDNSTGRTLYQMFQETKFKALPPASSQ